MNKRKYLLTLAVPAVLFLTACSSVSSLYTTDEQKQNNEGNNLAFSASHWQVKSITQGGIIDFSHVTLNMDQSGDINRISGSTGCNQYTGALDVANDGKAFSEDSQAQPFSVDKIVLTRKMCAPALMKQEQSFVDALTSSKSYAILDNTWLVLYDSNNDETVKAIISSPSQGSNIGNADKRATGVNKKSKDAAKKQDVVDSSIQTTSRTYECETPNASTTELRVNTLGPDTKTITINNAHHIVQLSRSASGAKYTNNKGVVYWNKGGVATVSINSGYYHCTINH
ncbi:META domain-containing protein [Alteromonas sp. BL110]|uniref:META domain-containing protein n=1 Tax=Alteromonas sp. BL110 TaxID=1714845 RepID=UPI000E4BB8A9|nr:META domain-containing protein [Alteromonas sp. BL110]AXT39603.1 META domain-containing protein [Alteromonas sp. BL110]RKM81910.1 META domain-containing protein [Alteromonas sp. BL110]